MCVHMCNAAEKTRKLCNIGSYTMKFFDLYIAFIICAFII